MSDQQKGLSKIIIEKYPQSEHQFCVQHMYNNFKKRFSGDEFRKKIWGISDSMTEEVFERNMDALRVYNQAAHEYLVRAALKEK
ncbi:hypothetical protein AAHA92_33194 [Salvia divinorum]|uniref:MULE transposase domain-containing protein n=1 Tax=Salvia divinorum TaxID=28513 RepID=A0ABD1FR89_SALDI